MSIQPQRRSPARGGSDRLGRARPYLFRAGWALADQVLSTATNFALVVLVARRTDASAFGVFALALAVVNLVQGAVRAAVGESLLVLQGAADPAEVRRATVAAAPIVLAVAAGGVLVTAPAWVGTAPGSSIVAAFAVCGAGLLLADLARYGYFAMRRPDLAAAVDAAWAVVMAVVVVVTDPRDAASTVVAWGAAGSLAGGIPYACWRVRPRLDDTRRWWSRSRRLAVRFAPEFLAGSGAGHAALLIVGAVASVPAAGAVRAAMLLFGPINVAFQALTPQAIVEGLHLTRGRDRLDRRLPLVVTSAFVVGVGVWTVVLVALPDAVGRTVLGSNWAAARQVVPAYAGFAAAGAIVAGAFIGLRVRRAAKESLRARIVSAAATVAGAAVGAYLAGAVGAAAGMAVGGLVGAAVWWHTLLAEPGTSATGDPLRAWGVP